MLARPKFDFPPGEIEAVLAMFRSKGELYEPAESPLTAPDPSNHRFLDCSYAAEADFIVTGNKRDFPDALYGVTRVANAVELLDRITLKLFDIAQQRWQRPAGAALLPLIHAGVKFIDGVQKLARTTNQPGEAAPWEPPESYAAIHNS